MTQPGWEYSRRIRFYGSQGHPVIALHGGPGAYGSAARISQGLSKEFRVLEPWQRTSGDMPLSVAVHIEDLHQLIGSRCEEEKPALVGESWGAMLALAYAAEHPGSIGAIVLVGCGTFDKDSRDVMVNVRKRRILEYIGKHPEHKADLEMDIGQQMIKWHGMTDAYEALPDEGSREASEPFDMKGHTETWEDMVRCQKAGLYPQAFASVKTPTIMLHGSYDPHPGAMIRDHLMQFIPQLEYHQFERCGHDPAMERYARDEFFAVMGNWLRCRFADMEEA
jgi:pimeloyl-ACP methyl ester carboxylesterase